MTAQTIKNDNGGHMNIIELTAQTIENDYGGDLKNNDEGDI